MKKMFFVLTIVLFAVVEIMVGSAETGNVSCTKYLCASAVLESGAGIVEGGVHVDASWKVRYEIRNMTLSWLDAKGKLISFEADPELPLTLTLGAGEGRSDYYQFNIVRDSRAENLRIDVKIYDTLANDWLTVSLTRPVALFIEP